MLFHSPYFLFYFLPLSLILHRLSAPKNSQGEYSNRARLCIFGMTLIFYGCTHVWWLIPFLICIFFDFLWATLISRAKSSNTRRWVICSVIQNICLLGFFKYWDPIQGRLSQLIPGFSEVLPPHGLDLPPGISFYIFESLSFVIDVYRKKVSPPKNPFEFFGFIGMFPRFIAGPIVRYRDMVDQFKQYRGMEIQTGLFIFIYGLFLKLCLADSAATFTPYAFSHSPEFVGAWIGTLAYTMQIYFDFSGYSLMAIGIGRCFGFQFPTNFNQPYFSVSIQDFWRRWHISLSSWLRDYLYISLGGNRHGKVRTYINLFLTMVIGGVWHGAGLTYVLWGIWQGLGLCIERALGVPTAKLKPVAARIFTMVFVIIGWVIFRANSTRQALNVLKAMGTPSLAHFNPEGLLINPVALIFLIYGFFHCFLIEPKIGTNIERITEIPVFWQTAALGVLGLSLFFGFSQFVVPFLYFQF